MHTRVQAHQSPFNWISALKYTRLYVHAPVTEPIEIASRSYAVDLSCILKCMSPRPGSLPTTDRVTATEARPKFVGQSTGVHMHARPAGRRADAARDVRKVNVQGLEGLPPGPGLGQTNL